MADLQAFQGPEYQRIPSVNRVVHGVKRRARLCSDEEYISLLNSNAFDFKASSLVFWTSNFALGVYFPKANCDPSRSSDLSLVIRSDAQPSNDETNHLSVRPAHPSIATTQYRSLRPFLPQPHLNTTSTQAPELDPSSASVTPVSPKTPPSFLNLKSSSTPEILNSKPLLHLSLPSILPTPPPSLTTSTTTTINNTNHPPCLSTTITQSLLQLGFSYIPEIQSLICLHCTKPRILYRGILRSHLRKHISEPSFQSLICELEHLVSQLPSFAKSIEEVPRRQCGRPALPFLPVLRGFRCLLCDFCAVSSRYVDNHWGEKHKGAPRPSVLYAPASLQTLGGSRQLTRLFWVV
ncbi:MAG: hypothetical protein M1816_001587 [Peltula sp. TS41687]|nr:MAG: hypothetical protein M1816_001587 [Peltula sp. TS41687]